MDRSRSEPVAPGEQAPIRRALRGDLIAISILLLLLSLVTLNRIVDDGWLARHDILAFYIPWYSFLGQQLRDLSLPGWNPHLFSGTLFAADPQSGWIYLPTMLSFPFFDPLTAMTLTVTIELVWAAMGAYFLARALRISPVGALAAAVVYGFGPVSYHQTFCCTVRMHVEAFLPMALLGIELAMRARSIRGRIAACFVSGLAISQILAGWLGQGSLNALLIVAAFVLYRSVLSPPDGRGTWRRRVLDCLGVGFGVLLAGIALDAAALFPRLALNGETTLAGGSYDKVKGGYHFGPYSYHRLVEFLLGDSFGLRNLALGGPVIVLSILALVLARRRFAVPFFAGLTIVVLILVTRTTPLHHLFFLIPRWKELHEHYTPQVTTAMFIGPAILTGATIDIVSDRAKALDPRWLVLPAGVIVSAALWIGIGYSDWVGVAGVTALLLTFGLLAYGRARPSMRRGIAWALIALLFIYPTGLELFEATTGLATVSGWHETWNPTSQYVAAPGVNTSTTDPGGAGAFLQEQARTQGVFRYVGYAGEGYKSGDPESMTYTDRRDQPNVQAVLVNGRSIFLGLYDTQGYNPTQLSRYYAYVTAMNGFRQDYHNADLRTGGMQSPLLDLLNVRYLLLDRSIPSDREDVVQLTEGRKLVFQNERVSVYENPNAFPHAWIVHNLAPTTTDQALDLVASGALDLHRTAVIERSPPAVAEPPAGALEHAIVTTYDANRIELDVSLEANGLVVLSDVYSGGWNAYIDGKKVEMLPADYLFRGIPVASGTHRLVLKYEPASLRAGVIVSLIALVAMAVSFGLLLVPRARRGFRGNLGETERSPAPERLQSRKRRWRFRTKHP